MSDADLPEAGAAGPVDAQVIAFADVPWRTVPGRDGMRGKQLVDGRGFHVQHVVMEPGYEVRPHSHSKDEVLVVLDGGCTFGPDGRQLAANDVAVLAAGFEYGFRVGSDGMRFLIFRHGPAEKRPAATASTRASGEPANQ